MPYKIYPGAGTLALPRELSLSQTPTLETLRTGSAGLPSPQLNLESITRLLFCADGLTRQVNVQGNDYHFRAAASAGALYPVELYLAASEVEGMEAGLYHFLPADLKMHGLRRGDWRSYLARNVTDTEAVNSARAVLIMTTMFWRSAWKYRARAYRYCFWDTGTILANLLAASFAEQLDARVITKFEDGPVERLLAIDGEREAVACIVTLGHDTVTDGESPGMRELDLESIPPSASEVVYDDLVRINRASRLGSSSELADLASTPFEPMSHQAAASPISIETMETDASFGLGETILRRGSTRRFAQEAIEPAELATILATSQLNVSLDLPAMTEIYAIINRVEGVPPGAFYYNRRTAELEMLKAGDFTRTAGYLCLEQPLGAECSALIVYMADLDRVLKALGNRGYRDAHLEAGLLAGRAYLAAYSLGRGATGLTFYDDDTTRFFQPHCATMSPLLMIAVGIPYSRRAPEA